jgi:hypothetical protein
MECEDQTMKPRDLLSCDSTFFKRLVLVTWLPLLLYLVPLPNSLVARSGLEDEFASFSFWLAWILYFVPVTCGLWGGVLAIKEHERWKLWVAIAGGIFLAEYVRELMIGFDLIRPSLLYFHSGIKAVDILQTEVRNVQFGLEGALPLYDAIKLTYGRIVMPLLQVYVLVIIARCALKGGNERTNLM